MVKNCFKKYLIPCFLSTTIRLCDQNTHLLQIHISNIFFFLAFFKLYSYCFINFILPLMFYSFN